MRAIRDYGRIREDRRRAGQDKPAGSGARTGSRKAGLSYMPGLDGLRALAVIAVLIYHAQPGWLPGGFLGVEVFFVISGFLITSLLLGEWRERGRVNVVGFWVRRARRLLPAVFLTIVVTLAYAVVFLPGEVAGLRGDAVAAFGYVTNWYLIFNQESYFEAAGRPSLLRHLWSLAIEEQFYLLWPLLFAIGLPRLRRLGPLAIVAGAVGSAVLMAVLYAPGVDLSRLYYGTDTRASGLLFGAALAFVLTPGRPNPQHIADRINNASQLSRSTRRLQRRWWWLGPLALNVTGLAALGGLVWFCLRLDEFRPFLYQGGFALVGLTTVAAIIFVAHPRATLGPAVLGFWLLRWIGLRSYGIYLWHWPVFMVTRPDLDVNISGLPLLALRLGATVVLASLSYSYVERPFRNGAVGRAWRRLRDAHGWRRLRLGSQWAVAAGACAAGVVALSVAVVHAKPPPPPSYLPTEAIHTSSPGQSSGDADATKQGSQNEAGEPQEPTPEESSEDASATPPEEAQGSASENQYAELPEVGTISAIGDSVMLGAAPQLQETLGSNLQVIDAEVGTQAYDAIAILEQRRAEGMLGDVMIVHIGNNGTFEEYQFDEIMGILGEDRKVVFVNVKVPRTWEIPNNQVLAEGVQRYPNATLVDWNAASAGRPDYFWEDGIHIRPEGQPVYTDLIVESLENSQ